MLENKENPTPPSHWTCPNCGRENGPEGVCPGCGFDNSANYLAYPTLMPLPQSVADPNRARREAERRRIQAEKRRLSEQEPPPAPKKRHWLWIVLLLAVALLAVWVAAYYASNHTKVESYLGMEISSAASQAEEELTVSKEAEVVGSSDYYGLVVEQSISAGKTVKIGRTITLTYGVPDFEGMSWQDACGLAEEQGIELNKASYVVSSSDIGTIYSATYSSDGASASVTIVVPDFEGMSWLDACDLAEEQGISLDVSFNTESGDAAGAILSAGYDSTGSTASVEIAVPDLDGMDQDMAVSQMEAAFGSIDVTTEEEYSDSVERGSIISYWFDLEDSSLSLTVSEGPEYVSVPDLAGMTPEEAQEALEAVGLVYLERSYDPVYYSSYEAGRIAFIHRYDVGDTVKQGTEIWVEISKGKIAQSGLITSNKSELTLTPGGDSASISLTVSSSMEYSHKVWTNTYNVTANWDSSGYTCSVSAGEDAENGWIQVCVWPSDSSYNNGDLPSDFVNIRLYVDAS